MLDNRLGLRSVCFVLCSLALGLTLSACDKPGGKTAYAPKMAPVVAPAPSTAASKLRGEQGQDGALLAYEHRLDLTLPAPLIAQRIQDLRDACETAKFGSCNVLQIEQRTDLGRIVVRIAPAGVEPLVNLATVDGELGERTTRAEDLAEAVASNGQRQERLQSQQKRLDALAQRHDLGVTDLIALSKEQADIENELQGLTQDAAVQQRRLDTNLLSLNIRAPEQRGVRNHAHRSFDELVDNFYDGVADALEKLSYALPFIVLLFPLLLLWVWLWRKFIRRRT